jgi:1-acyl-sn-glycerol-3-phosphate acyltransferase
VADALALFIAVIRDLILPLVEALFRVLFTYDCVGEENVPDSGPALVVANHPSYLDPILLSLQVRRPIRFMAWDALFRVPLLGSLIRAFGAFPVDTRRGRGRDAYAKARALIEKGQVVGLFPEGGRSRTGWMEPTLREGAARLVLETGAPLVPATIAGAYRAWPHYQSLPRPARIRVRFHDPIDPAPYRAMPEAEGIAALIAELRRRVDRSLLPGVKADLRMNRLYRNPAPWPRWHESGPALLLALVVFYKTRVIADAVPAYAYIGYLLLDHFLIPQRRLVKWIRNVSPVAFMLFYGEKVRALFGLPEVVAPAALVSIVGGALFPYLYDHGRRALNFIAGLVLACGLELLALYYARVGVGPHIALPLYAAAYAWERRTVFWRYATPVLVAYAVAAALLLGPPGRAFLPALLPHAVAGLLAWMLVRFAPRKGEARSVERPPTTLSLGLGTGRPGEDDVPEE